MNREKLHYYLDGEMPAEERAAFERELEGDAQARAELQYYKSLDAALRGAYEPSASEAEAAISKFKFPARGGRLKLYVAVAAALAAGLLIGIFVDFTKMPNGGPAMDATKNLVGVATVASGPFTVTGDSGNARAASAGELLTKEMIISIPANTRAACVLRDGSEVRLDRGAEVQLKENRSFILKKGRVWARLTAGEPFRIICNESCVAAAGAELQIQMQEKNIKVEVFSGNVAAGPAGASRALGARECAMVDNNIVLVPERIESIELATAWTIEIDAAAGGREIEIVGRLDRMMNEVYSSKLVDPAKEAAIRDIYNCCRAPVAGWFASNNAKSNLDIRRSAARVLCEVAEPGIAMQLLTGLTDEDESIRATCRQAIESMGTKFKDFDASKFLQVNGCAAETQPILK